MAVERFEGAFHQSTLKTYLKCPRVLYYQDVLGLDRDKVSLANLGGTAGHSTLEWAHLNNNWDPDAMMDYFLVALDYGKERAIEKGQEIHGNLDPEKYRKILAEYAKKQWNREARVIVFEANFNFSIKPSKTEYAFTGRIDQLVEIPADLLAVDFPRFRDWHKGTVILHRDTKFGQRRNVSQFELALDTQFDVYAYAFAHGLWYINGADEPITLDVTPDLHAKYFVQDHIPYESDAGPYLKDEVTGGRVVCDIVAEPCLVGKSMKACEGKRSWCTKQTRGPAMYFTNRTAKRLEQIPVELGRVCASIRMGHYPRQLGELCFTYCQFRSVCEAEVKGFEEDDQAAAAVATVEAA